MALINQFQIYSQGENTITNNVLLMLSHLYEINPKYYEAIIRGLTEDANRYEAIPSFLQQIGNKGDGIIDGHIQIKASRIVIETKISGTEWVDKLVKYSKIFEQHEYKILFHLSSSKYSDSEIDKITRLLADKVGYGQANFYSITYQDLVGQLTELAKVYPHETSLQRLSEHFEIYCLSMGLMPRSSHVLRAMACGGSFDLNVKHRFYFDPASRGYSKFNYLGIYKWKSVKHIGKIENTIVANWNEQDGLNIIDSEFDVTAEQRQRLIEAIRESVEFGWDIDEGHRFFLLNDFQPTEFNKSSPGGMLRVRYFNLEDYLNPFPKEFGDVAEQLRMKSWE